MARFFYSLIALGLIFALVIGCEMPWDEDENGDPPDPPTVRQFVVTNTGSPQSHNLNVRDDPRVTIQYDQNDNPRVAVYRSAPDDNHPGFVDIGNVWHGGDIEDSGLHLTNTDNRLVWGHRYVYRLYGFNAEGGPSGPSENFELTLPNHHAPRNVGVRREGEYNVISWDRTAVDDQNGKTVYYVYGRIGANSFQEVSGGSVDDTTFNHYHNDENYEYAVRARHENYGWTVAGYVGDGTGNGDDDNDVPGEGDDDDSDDDDDGAEDNGDEDNGGPDIPTSNEFVFQGQSIALNQLWFENVGSMGDGAYQIAVYIASEGVNVNHSPPTGGDVYVFLDLHFSGDEVSPGTYQWTDVSSPLPAGVFTETSVIVTDPHLGNYHYAIGGSVTIEKSGDVYTISGSVQTDEGTAAFRYEGILTGWREI